MLIFVMFGYRSELSKLRRIHKRIDKNFQNICQFKVDILASTMATSQHYGHGRELVIKPRRLVDRPSTLITLLQCVKIMQTPLSLGP